MSPPVQRLLHPVLDRPGGREIDAVTLTDRQRIAAVLEAAALLQLLDSVEWHLEGGLDSLRIDSKGRLVGGRAVDGLASSSPHAELRGLLLRLFRARDRVSGRGEGRRAARQLLASWRGELALPPVSWLPVQILDLAPFLWREELGHCRRSLVGGVVREGRTTAWVAGAPRRRRALVERLGSDLAELRDALASTGGRELWDGSQSLGAPADLARDGRDREAVRAWSLRPPTTPEERLVLARCLVRLGKFERALALVNRSTRPAGRSLKVGCLFFLGHHGAAARALAQVPLADLVAADRLDLLEVAIRLAGRRGDPGMATSWIEATRTDLGSEHGAELSLFAAEAAWDRQDLGEMTVLLERAASLRENPLRRWRWHEARALLAASSGDAARAVAELESALRSGRRGLAVRRAASLWNDLAMARVRARDLPGGERAAAHAVRLYGQVEGPRRRTVGLRNLAEVRLRRGRLIGVRSILDDALAQSRWEKNAPAAAEDEGVWARYELVTGHPGSALETCLRARSSLERCGETWHRAELGVLAARALGWLDRPSEARELLESGAQVVEGFLEPEEWPAVWALAGDRERALTMAGGDGAGPLWRSALLGEPPAAEAWRKLRDEIEPYRWARVVFDLAVVAPRAVPPPVRQEAAALLDDVGAHALGARLGAGHDIAWRALAEHCRGEGRWPELFDRAGYGAARVIWRGDDGSERVVVSGAGGSARRSTEGGDGTIELEAPVVDEPLEALFALCARELRGVAPLQPTPRARDFIGRAPALLKALDRAERLGRTDLPILIRGETGTGKELMANRLHRVSARAAGPFVPLSCAEISEHLVLSELFGHARGAFTGAIRDRTGVFEASHGGTVFLDEIGDLPPAAQGMMLRVLERGEVRRVGEVLARTVDVRVVAATHRDLEAMAAEGTFRADLFYRLRGGRLELPPLRDRGDDVVLLAEWFLEGVAVGTRRPVLSAAARTALLAHDWPGNVRQLRHTVLAAAALAGGPRIEPEHLELPTAGARKPGREGGYHEQIEALRRRLVVEALEASGWRQAEAARRLGLSRQALSYLVRQLRILPPRGRR